MIIAIVVIISSQRPNVPIKKIKKPYKKPEKTDLKYHPSRITIIINSHHGNQTKKSSIPLIVLDEMRNIKSNNPLKVVSIKLTNESTYCPNWVCISGKPPINTLHLYQQLHTSLYIKFYIKWRKSSQPSGQLLVLIN